MPTTECDGRLFKEALLGSLAWLTINRDEVDALNVFPVPDGDTGTNMLLTLQSAVEDIRSQDDPDLSVMAKRAAHGALMGARGNSGVILSQILRGFCQGIGSEASVDGVGLARAFEQGAQVAYRAVMKPTEGTMLTVAREAARAARASAAQNADLTAVVKAAAEAAAAAVEQTPQQLPILKQAGVVDAGGFGLQLILEGFLKRMQGEKLESFERPSTHHARPKLVEAPSGGWGYCTEFIINGEGLEVDDVRTELQRHGDSALVVGDESAIKVHIHTQEPAAVISYASGVGTLSRLKVDDMSSQHHRLQGEGARRPASSKRLAVVAVASGDGFRRILESLGVDSVVGGGQTMNPSTQDILSAVESVPSDDVLVLPNNGNVIMTAQQVSELTRKRVRVVPSRSLPQGIAALFAFDFSADLEANANAMSHALKQVQTIEVTRAVRDSEVDGLTIAEGDVIGLLNDRIVEKGDSPEAVVRAVLKRIDPKKLGTITIYAGADVDEAEREALCAAVAGEHPTASIELQLGEQALYPYVVAVE
ncbi:MAG TPA: DAK2 domain-containing protein [Candidatus Dormibacteraeota bacterium]|nr:DAK2 domain-containing protein [Candidatus Dormibacteraeota bacterium]